MAESVICSRAFEFAYRILKLAEWELQEAGELRAMIVAAIKTARASPSRG